ncbi:MAG: hypothetical protein ACI4U9_05575 [Clostridia bacterium]
MSMFSLLISLFAVIFWALRVAVAFTASMGIEFMLEPLNLPVEIILTFITFVCIILIFKRSLIGALVYLISNLGYYGVYLYNIIVKTEEIVVVDYLNIIVSIIGILLPLIIFIDIGMSQSSKKTSNKTKKTDWYYQNDKYDRQYDDRADRNQYKF